MHLDLDLSIIYDLGTPHVIQCGITVIIERPNRNPNLCDIRMIIVNCIIELN